MPKPTAEILERSVNEFQQFWQFPNCFGALDGKHVIIQCPQRSGSLYFNYKKTFSINLMALVDARYRFLAVDIGSYGRNSDGGVFSASSLGKCMESGNFNIPAAKPLPNKEDPMPHVAVGDEAFPLKTYLLRPYPGVHQDTPTRVFNYRLSRARRIVENAFGILAVRWRIFQRRLQADPVSVEKMVRATCCLHNFLQTPIEPSSVEEKSSEYKKALEQAKGLRPFHSIGVHASYDALQVRDYFRDYFISSAGMVPWQNNVVNRGRQFNNTNM